MICRNILSTFAIVTLGLALAAINGNRAVAVADELNSEWTVVATDYNGAAWGAGTAITTNQARAIAFANCKRMSKKEIGCGARSVTMGSGWILGLRCGSEFILVADDKLKDAEDAAIARELELRQVYLRDMPACKRAFSVDPLGIIDHLVGASD